MLKFLLGVLTGGGLVSAYWFYRAQILGYATKEVDELRARIRNMGGKL